MRKNRRFSIVLSLFLASSPVMTFAQTTTSFSGQAVAVRASAAGLSLALSDTGPLPSAGGNLKTSLANVNILGLVSAEALSSAASGSGTTSQSQSSVANLNLLNGLVAADLVKSNANATCSGGQATTSGNSELVGLTVAGMPIVTSTPNVAISAPGGISVIVNEQSSSTGGNTGSMTVNALHVTGPTVEIVVASARSGITC
ncbi:MAG TPA: choice-of-anchor P family protein [Vicinamibacterales bacterium]|jgi:hypothetical protein